MHFRVRPAFIIFFVVFFALVGLFTALGIPWYGAVVLVAIGLVIQWIQDFF
ncbi:MAG: hypothetical protein HGA19_13275 [Oscillochloris sp.]|nr:hypothetical protein [Oscillochloris sp.]